MDANKTPFCSNSSISQADEDHDSLAGDGFKFEKISGKTIFYKVEYIRKCLGVNVSGECVPNPECLLENIPFPEFLKRKLHTLQYTRPTPVQAQCWPILLSGRDMMCIGHTDAGKTLGYLLPGIAHTMKLLNVSEYKNPIMLVVAPTVRDVRNLWLILNEFISTVRFATRIVILDDEMRLPPDSRQSFQRGFEIALGTPYCVVKMLEMGNISLNGCSYVAIDSCDQIFEMGFLSEIELLLKNLSHHTQCSIWMTQLNSLLKTVIQKYLKSCIYLSYERPTMSLKDQQFCEVFLEGDKPIDIMKFMNVAYSGRLEANTHLKIIILLRKISHVKEIFDVLKSNNLDACFIHSQVTSAQRERSLSYFYIDVVNILIITEKVAKTLCVKALNYVVNFNYADDGETKSISQRRLRHNNFGFKIGFVEQRDYKRAHVGFNSFARKASYQPPMQFQAHATPIFKSLVSKNYFKLNKIDDIFCGLLTSQNQYYNQNFRNYNSGKNTGVDSQGTVLPMRDNQQQGNYQNVIVGFNGNTPFMQYTDIANNNQTVPVYNPTHGSNNNFTNTPKSFSKSFFS